ncbi:hypothetical protein JR316_0006681 [Psilocybe cubensis]|uniref:Uncharacterized protein n=2 Tax=Psilocybe cubensis TaxID=181762 RepID=A0ACB8GWW8_PSICU|nr:hypothetical protein JR316_0006681 [Psilocybe cubensis]KAH9480084.1 hypothetical protein JR316_0006681 [Psilocybe cubensis]
MELTLEAYRNIVKNVGNRADIASLCRVSRGFKRVAERALYNTLFMRNDEETVILCNTLANSPQLAVHVDALTIMLSDEEGDDSEGEDEDIDESDDEKLPPVDMDWHSVARALEKTVYLRYLNIHINNGTTSAVSWVLEHATFQLRRFHSDFDWDQGLVRFLNKQGKLEDLYIQDYRDIDDSATPTTSEPLPSRSLRLESSSIPQLSTLECTFSEAAMALVPGRPVTHLKTCFSRTELDAKKKEMNDLLTSTGASTCPMRSLDIADSSYTERFSAILLSAISERRTLVRELRHLGTFVLPIDGRERLQFYGLLMRFPQIRSIELEVSNWQPPPSSPAALRALASELRLYNPTVTKIVFVHDFDRSVVTAVKGICRVDPEINTDLLWREK